MIETIEDDQTRLAQTLARETPKTIAQIRRDVVAESGRPFSYRRARDAVRLARTRPLSSAERLDPSAMADRIMRLLDRDLAGIEAASGRIDLERLDRIAATLRRIEPIRPKAEGRKTASLRSLLPTADEQAEGSEQTEGLASLRSAEG